MAQKRHEVEWVLKVGAEGSEQVKALRAELDKVGQINSFAALKKKTEDARSAWESATSDVKRLAREIAATESPSKKLSSEFERAKKTAGDLKQRYEQQGVALQKMRAGLQASGVSTANLAQAQLQAKGRVAALQGEVDKASRGHGIFKSMMTSTAAVTEKTTGAVHNLVAAYIGLNAIQMGGQYILQNMRQSEQSMYNLEASVRSANREFGTGIGTMDSWQQRLQALGGELKIYSNSELRNAASRTVDMTKRLGLSVEQMQKVVEIAGNLGAGKTSLEDSVERVTAALRGEAESAEYLGLTLNEDYVKGQYTAADATGLLWKELTDVEKAQARFNELLKQSEGMNGRAAGSINTLNGSLAFMKATIDNTLESNGDLKESIKDMSKELASAAPSIVSYAENLTSLLATLVKIIDILPDGTGGAVVTGLITTALFGATGKIFTGMVAALGLVPAQIGAIVGGYVLLENQIAKLAQHQEGTPQWLIDADNKINGYLSFLNSGNAADVQAGLAQAAERQRQEQVMLQEQVAAQKEAQAQIVEAERAAAEARAGVDSELLALRKTNWDELLKKAKETLKEAEADEKRYSEQVKALQEERAQASLSTQEKVRALLRTQMTDYDAYQDKLREANESLNQAKLAASGGQGELAETWAKKAQGQFAELNSEIKDGENILLSAAQANAIAVNGVVEAGKLLEQSLLSQEKAAEGQRIIAEETKNQAIADIEEIGTAQEKIKSLEIEAAVKDLATEKLNEIQRELAAIKDKTVTVTVRYKSVGGLATGGRVPGYAFGGRLPGYSLTDNMMGVIQGRKQIALAGGEDVTNALSSRIIYRDAPWLLPALNRVRSTADLSRIISKLQNVQGLANGGRVSESFRVTLAAGSSETSVTTSSRSEYDGLKGFAKALNKANLVRG